MQSRTELMEDILRSETAQKIIDYITPIYGEAYVFLWILQMIGAALDDLNSFPNEYIKQITPSTATWTIKFWEQEYDIKPNEELSLEQRRTNLINRIKANYRMNPWNIKGIAENITGHKVEIKENTGINKFTIATQGDNTLEAVKKQQLIEEINKIKPAHLIYSIEETVLFETMADMYLNVYSTYHEYMQCQFSEEESVVMLTDKYGNVLTDESGRILTA